MSFPASIPCGGMMMMMMMIVGCKIERVNPTSQSGHQSTHDDDVIDYIHTYIHHLLTVVVVPAYKQDR